jgi:serine/threonine-protein kinase RsbW
MASLSEHFPATPEALTKVMAPVQAFLLQAGVPDPIQHHAQLMIEEIGLNAIDHGKSSAEDAIHLTLSIESDWLTIEIRDHGEPFDPTQHEPPDTTLSLEERSIGGLGVYLTQTLADELAYRRENNQNCLVIRKRITAAGA